MRIVSGDLRLAATDVSNHLACHHLTHLELSAARGLRERPQWEAPDLVVIRELGLRHEADYLAFLKNSLLESNTTFTTQTTGPSILILIGSTLSGSPSSIVASGGAVVISYGNNVIRNGGVPTQTLVLQ